MNVQIADQAKERLRAVRTAYDHEHEQPLAGYTAAIAGYGAFLAVLGAGVKLSGTRLPRRVRPVDVLLGGLAVHKAVRLLAKDAVTSPIRAPFTEFSAVRAVEVVRLTRRPAGSSDSAARRQ